MPERPFSQGGDACRIIAHRGASAIVPENTLEAFDVAVAAGSDAIEFDVRLTSDAVPIVMHDPTLDRTTDGTGLVRATTLAEIKRLRVSGSRDVPTLGEVLRELSGRAGVVVELKNLPGEPDFDPDDALTATVAAELDAAAFLGDVILVSFNPVSVARARELARGVSTGLLTGRDVDAPVAAGFAGRAGHDWALPFVARVLDGIGESVAASRSAGVRLGTWVVDEPAVARTLAEGGVDAVATNDPGLIAGALGR